ncbi:MAG: protein kinase domain-containing protein [Ktedonobacteraceae bacterium]
MEFFDGQSLSRLLTHDPLDREKGLDVCIQICQALSHAHMKGVIHRDLKPSNIIFTKAPGGADLVHLLDFGIAKVNYEDVRATQDLTQTVDVIGSPAYMSPEQCLGMARRRLPLDRRRLSTANRSHRAHITLRLGFVGTRICGSIIPTRSARARSDGMVSIKITGQVEKFPNNRWRPRAAKMIVKFIAILLSASPLVGTPVSAGSIRHAGIA